MDSDKNTEKPDTKEDKQEKEEETSSPVEEQEEQKTVILKHHSEEKQKPRIISFVTGKGGVGQSAICANMAVYLAQTGRKVLLVDSVRWGRNLHTFLGIQPPNLTLDSLSDGVVDDIEQLIVDTPYQNLKLLTGVKESKATSTSDEPPYIIKEVRKLNFNLVIIDLGSQVSFSLFDHLLWADHPVIITVPEPTAMERSYELLRGLYFRLFKTIETRLELSDLIEKAMVNGAELGVKTPSDLADSIRFFDPKAGAKLIKEIEKFKLYLVVNNVRNLAEEEIGSGIVSASKRYFGINLKMLGNIHNDSAIPASIRQRKPVHLMQKDAKATKQIEQIAHKLLSEDIKGKHDEQNSSNQE